MHNAPNCREFILIRARRRWKWYPNFQSRAMSKFSPRNERDPATANILAAGALLEVRAFSVFSAHVNRQANIDAPLSTPLRRRNRTRSAHRASSAVAIGAKNSSTRFITSCAVCAR
jgi:hypothetical protein